MDTKLYHLHAEFWLTPKIYNGSPEIIVRFDNDILYQGLLTETRCFEIDKNLPKNQYQISVEFNNKQNSDTDIINNLDKAVIIDRLSFNNIKSDNFKLEGIYYPDYPEPWASQQQAQGVVLKPQLPAVTYLGWNGVWRVNFSMPIFTWIHGVEKLGWIRS